MGVEMIREESSREMANDTRITILTHLLSEDLTAIDLKRKLNINESAIRRHLDILESKNLIIHRFERAPKGRPKKVYHITRVGRDIFPQKTHMLFTLLLRRMREKYGAIALREMISEVAEDFAEHLVSDVHAKSKDRRLRELVRSLNALGFYAILSKRRKVYSIKYKNCVFGSVIWEFGDLLCDMHRQTVSRILGDIEVKLEKSIARGDNVCVQRIVFGRK
jgi:predicted ArsR family transcriptional regulator